MTDGAKTESAEDLPVLQFAEAYKKFSASLKSSFEADRLGDLEKTSNELVTSDNDNKKLTLDQCFREYLTLDLHGARPKIDLDKAQRFVHFAIQAARKELCNPTTPIQVLADIFDMLPLSSCEVLFKSVEVEVATWRSRTFYQSIKNGLLRICNDLLRRLSRTQNTVFCGRIQLFLAKFFPFSERSGLNVISEFNLDNVTSFSKQPLVVDTVEKPAIDDQVKVDEKGDGTKEKEDDKKDTEEKDEAKKDESEPMEIELIVEEKEKLEVEKKKDVDEEKKEDSVSVKAEKEFALYSQFWKLQDFFRCPTQCYEKEQWDKFCEFTTHIIQTFSKKKLDTRAAKKENSVHGKDQAASFVDQYFAKYLTNQNLLNLQLNDSNFRRYVLVQYLIIFQYLQTNVKFKTETQVISTDQTKWIDENRRRVFKLIEETPPNGKAFALSVKSILKREQIWIGWKNEGCPSFVIKKEEIKQEDTEKKAAELESKKEKSRKRKIPLGEMMKRDHKAKKINLGNKGLTKLWNLSPDNLGACKAQERNFLPSLESFFEEAIEEIDPRNKVEDSYKKVNNGEWGWRALRLMSRRSQHFFLLGNSQISKLPEYLEMMLGKMANDFGKPIGMDDPEPEKNGDTPANGDTNGASNMSGKLTDDQLATLTEKLAAHWKALIPKLGLPTEKVEELSAQGGDIDICLKLLMAWADQEGEGASPDEISYILGGLKLAHLIEGVF